MTKFRAPILRGLEGIYRFVGSQVRTDAVELERPITLVHDVSGMVGDEVGQYFSTEDAMNHSSAGNIRRTIDPYAEAEAIGWGRERSTVFLVNWEFVTTVTADFDSAIIALAIPASYSVDAAASWYVLGFGDTTLPKPSASSDFPIGAAAEPYKYPQIRLPIHIPTDADVQVSSTTTGTPSLTVNAHCLFWVGPKGLAPPGL